MEAFVESFALWYESKIKNDVEPVVPVECEVHVNFWMELGINKEPFIDLGIKVNDISKIKKINIFIPFEITKNNITDMGSLLKTQSTANVVFNEKCTIINATQPKQFKVSGSDEFIVYELDINHDIEVTKNYEGTLITINKNFSYQKECKKYYFRIRIITCLLDKIVNTYQASSPFLQSAISLTKAINFRFNDIRTLNSSLLEVIDEQDNFIIQKFHFFLLTRADTDIITNGYISERELEKKIWDEYVGFTLSSDIVAYHWKFKKEEKEESINDIILFIKMKINIFNKRTIRYYLSFLGILTIIFNILSKVIIDKLSIIFNILFA
jgi:hypothetical protein